MTIWGWIYASVGKLVKICNPIKNMASLQEDIKRLIFIYYKNDNVFLLFLCLCVLWKDEMMIEMDGGKNSWNYLERRLMLEVPWKTNANCLLSEAGFLCSLLQLAWKHHGDTIILH